MSDAEFHGNLILLSCLLLRTAAYIICLINNKLTLPFTVVPFNFVVLVEPQTLSGVPPANNAYVLLKLQNDCKWIYNGTKWHSQNNNPQNNVFVTIILT